MSKADVTEIHYSSDFRTCYLPCTKWPHSKKTNK